jgi:hypothetical protein
MEKRVEAISLENGQKVLVEVYETEGEVERVGVGDKAAKTFEAAWDTVQPAVQALAKRIAQAGPTETQIKFGIKISADLNAIIASSKGEANFEVTLSWKPQQ